MNELCGEGLVVHEEEVDITGVVDKEGLVAGGHHVAGLLVGTIANLYVSLESVLVLAVGSGRAIGAKKFIFEDRSFRTPRIELVLTQTYRWHGNLALEPSSDTVVNTLGLSPAWVDTFVAFALVSVEALRAYTIHKLIPVHPSMPRIIPNAILHRSYSEGS